MAKRRRAKRTLEAPPMWNHGDESARHDSQSNRPVTWAEFTRDARKRVARKRQSRLLWPATATGIAAILALGGVALPVSIGAAIIGVVGTASAWLIDWGIFSPKRYTREIEHYREHRAKQDVRSVEHIMNECERLGGEPALEVAKEARELTAAYQKLRRKLKEALGGRGDPSVDQDLALAEDAYQTGIAILSRALGVSEALLVIDNQSLQREVRSYERDRDRLTDEDPERSTFDRLIAKHQERIDQYEELGREHTELLAESNAIESDLETAFAQVARRGGNASHAFRQTGMDTALKKRMEAARRVEERLSSLGKIGEADLEELRAASKSQTN